MIKDIVAALIDKIPQDGSCARLFHGRGKLYPDFENIVVDFYPPVLLITLYKETDDVILHGFLNFPVENILIQKRYLNRPEVVVLKGTIPNEIYAFEGESKYQLSIGSSQNIGFFLDMSLGRKWISENSKGKKVLNLFSYTCSLSVAALMGEAEEVVNFDMSKSALSVGKRNHQLNNIDLKKVKFFSHDIMKSWNKIIQHGPYDIVILDPPTNQGASFEVERDYHKIIKRLSRMLKAEATVMACLNSPHLTTEFIKNLFNLEETKFTFVEMIPSAFSLMERNKEEGLKIMIFKNNSD